MRPIFLSPGEISADQQAIFDECAAGKRGRVTPPLRAWIHSPEMARHSQRLGQFLRYDTSLGPRLSELAILANSTWGAFLHDHTVPGIYRSQRGFGAPGPKRTRMQTTAAPHEGLGVAQYAWSTSPLRRYVDLVNQWQLLACVQHGVTAKLAAPFKPKDADLYAVVQGFDDTYTAYADYQRRMEYFWCLRWLAQEQKKQVVASVVKGDLVRLEEIPLLLHVPGLGVHARGTRVLLDVMSLDELTIEASVRLLNVLDAPTVTSGDAADDDEEAEGGDDTLVDAADASAETEAEALAEADGATAEGGDAASGNGSGSEEGRAS